METSLKTVRNNFPDTIQNINKIRDNLIKKYKNEIIKNVLDFRKVAKLATAPKNVDYSRREAERALNKIFGDNTHSIEEIFNTTVNPLYSEKKLISNFNLILTHISSLNEDEKHDEDIIQALVEIRAAIDKILKD
jgi:precorrin-6B methylase 2